MLRWIHTPILLLAATLSGCGSATQPVVDLRPPVTEPAATPEPVVDDGTEEQATIDALQPVIDKWLRGRKLKPFEELSGQAAEDSNVMEVRTTYLDVNSDGQDELAIQTACAAVGNCSFYLFQKTKAPEGYRILLNTNMVQTFKLLRAASHGYSDIEIGSHGSAISGGTARFKYNGTDYDYSECFGYEYELKGVDKNGKGIVSDKPRITPADCSDWPSVYRGQPQN